MKELKTEIMIKAAPEVVWAVLTDFDNYKNWNPFIRSLTGDVAVGNNIEIVLKQSEEKTATFKPKVLVFEKNKELRWIGSLLFRGIFDGEHKFELIENGSGDTILKQSEKFNGLLIPLFKNKIENNFKTYFEEMNVALKNTAEKKE